MKTVFKILGILLLGVFLFAAYIIWLNVHSDEDPEALLASMPDEIHPKYSQEDSTNWWKSTAVYQIYPRSFKDSDGDGIGDIPGIISQLDYIQSLGFETIWFSPFFKSPQADHGYDVSDYREIQPAYGDMALVDSLIAEIHKRDMKIVLDLVLNHTSIEHAWFQESRKSKDNPKSDWYVWRDGQNGDPPNNWKNILGRESAWTYVPEREQYYYAAFLPFQPDLNMANPEVKAAIFDMVKFWLDKNVDGFRLDIFNFIFEDENFPDNPFTWQALPKFGEGKWSFEDHRYNFHQPEVITFAKELRAVLESYPNGRFMVGEVFGSHRHMRELLGMEHADGLNLVFLFDFLESFEFSAAYFHEKATEYEAFYPYPLVPTYVFGNHDQFRSITRLNNSEQKAEVLAAYQLTMRGVPFVYYGEEIGMRTSDIPLEDAQDPIAKYWLGLPTWLQDNMPIMLNRDNCRTPMQWSAAQSAGFSSSPETWLPIPENFRKINVQDRWADETSIIHTYSKILQLRNDSKALKAGQLKFLNPAETLPQDVLSYSRFYDDQELTVYLNFSEEKQALPLHEEKAVVKYKKRATLAGQNIELEGLGILITENSQ
jgi:alpha-glucosidase